MGAMKEIAGWVDAYHDAVDSYGFTHEQALAFADEKAGRLSAEAFAYALKHVKQAQPYTLEQLEEAEDAQLEQQAAKKA